MEKGDLLQNNVSVYSVICHRLGNIQWEPVRVAFSELSILPFLVSPIWPWLGWLALLVARVNYSTPTELPESLSAGLSRDQKLRVSQVQQEHSQPETAG